MGRQVRARYRRFYVNLIQRSNSANTPEHLVERVAGRRYHAVKTTIAL